MIAAVAGREHGSGSIARVLRILARNRDLRRVELAFATFNVAEWGTWLPMLVYAYAHGGVTAAGGPATARLVPAAGGAPPRAGGLRGAIPAGKGAHRRVPRPGRLLCGRRGGDAGRCATTGCIRAARPAVGRVYGHPPDAVGVRTWSGEAAG